MYIIVVFFQDFDEELKSGNIRLLILIRTLLVAISLFRVQYRYNLKRTYVSGGGGGFECLSPPPPIPRPPVISLSGHGYS
jgi:hypothetical protein